MALSWLPRERNGDREAGADRLNELAQYFPQGLEYKTCETTSLSKPDIDGQTLLEAIALVFPVMYLNLQNFLRHVDSDDRRAGSTLTGTFRALRVRLY